MPYKQQSGSHSIICGVMVCWETAVDIRLGIAFQTCWQILLLFIIVILTIVVVVVNNTEIRITLSLITLQGHYTKLVGVLNETKCSHVKVSVMP